MLEPVQALWIGRPLSRIERLSIASFLDHGHAYHLYCYEPVGNVPPGVVVRDAAEILPATEIFSHREGPAAGAVAPFSDLFRFKLLLDRGGWWVDTDVVCLRPFDFAEPVVFAAEHARVKAKLATAVIRLPAAHSIAAQCYERAAAVDRRTVRWGEIGPDLLTAIVVRDGLRHPVMKPAVFCPVPWWDWRGIVAPDARPVTRLIEPESHAIHLWHEMWRREGLAEAQAVADTSLFAQLLRRHAIA